MIAWAIETLLASGVLIALALVVRVPVRRYFGPAVAYALWSLPLLRLVLPPLPEGWLRPAIAPLAVAGEQVGLLVGRPVATGAAPSLLGPAVAALWCAGMLLFLSIQVLAYRRFTRRVMREGRMLGRVGRIMLVVSDAVPGPLAYGLVRPVVAVPSDFRLRWGPAERELALAHEVAHHRRGDVAANWAALGVLALHWFNPVAWVALRAFRADQEMANDAHVLGRFGAEERHSYACAIAKAAGARIPAAACGLHTADNLKGRLRMLSHSTSRNRRLCGAVAITGATLCLLAATASGSDAAETIRAGVERATGVPLDAFKPTELIAVASTAAVDSPAPRLGKRKVHVYKEGKTARVTITDDGRTRVYEGREANAWLAANPVPPVPALPALPIAGDLPPVPSAPLPQLAPPAVTAARCAGGTSDHRLVVDDQHDGRRQIVICKDRIAAVAAQAHAERANAALARGDGLRAALEGLRSARASMTDDHEAVDRAIRNLESMLGNGG